MRAWAAARNPRFTFHDAGRAQGITKLREDGRVASEVSGHMQEKTVNKVYDRRTFRKAKTVECVGWLMGFEPTTTGITIQDSTAELQPPPMKLYQCVSRWNCQCLAATANWRARQDSNLLPPA